MTRATAGKPTEPAYYMSIFERGIDPGNFVLLESGYIIDFLSLADVDNPELCHAHSEVPDTWPALDEMLEYQARVRKRILQQIGIADSDRKVGRALWLAFEHEAMHLETFLYMLLQSERILPPPGQAVPDFKAMAAEARQNRIANRWHRVPGSTVTLGLDDPENDHGPDRFFGWDNERPSRKSAVAEFEAQARPISNGEYARFLEQSGHELLPASWSVPDANGTSNGVNGILSRSEENGSSGQDASDVPSEDFLNGKFVRTVYGPVPLAYALDWPVMASYDELAAFAKWSDGRIPTFEEARSIYSYVEAAREEAAKVPSSLISAVNGFVTEVSGKPWTNLSQTFVQQRRRRDPPTRRFV
jgi:L-histidine Nalpha-methyltransferase / hercynylcysteine S-oxide synthase